MSCYTQAAVEWAMKVQGVILRALSGELSWIQVADILGLSARTVRRLRDARCRRLLQGRLVFTPRELDSGSPRSRAPATFARSSPASQVCKRCGGPNGIRYPLQPCRFTESSTAGPRNRRAGGPGGGRGLGDL